MTKEFPSTPHQRMKINVLLPKEIKSDKDAKEDFIVQFSQDNARTSTKQLTYKEANEALEFLGATPQRKYTPNSYYALFDKDNSQHNYLLSQCHQIGWIVYHEGLAKNVADLERLGKWIKETGYLHKSLKLYDSSELPKLVYQFDEMVRNYVV